MKIIFKSKFGGKLMHKEMKGRSSEGNSWCPRGVLA